MQLCQNLSITCTGAFQKVVLLEISRNLQFPTLTSNNFLKRLDWSLWCSFFLVNCVAKITYSSLAHFWNSEKFLRYCQLWRSFFIEQTLADLLCSVEDIQESLQVQLKRTPLQVFAKVAGKFPKSIGTAYENSKTFYKLFYADAETSTWQFRYFNEKMLY